MIIDYGNKITNLIAKYLPYTNLNFGTSYQAQTIDISSDKVTLTLDNSDYTIISDIINDALYPNVSFTISGFYLKNTITSFVAYPNDSTSPYAFLVDFRLPHKLKKYDEITLKGFTDTDYNTTFKVMKAEDAFQAILYPTDSVTVQTLTTGLGFIPVQYTEGFNGIKNLTDEGSNQVSFTFDTSLYYTETSIDNVDIDYQPYIHYYLDNLKYMDYSTFLKNLADSSNNEYLIIDSNSFSTFPLRSNTNTSEASYNAFSRTGHFDTLCSLDIYYIMERNIDDSNNQTESGSDILSKHVDMFDTLISIIRQPLVGYAGKVMSSLTITNSGPSDNIIEGRKIREFTIEFEACYQNPIMVEADLEESYPIDSINYNENIIDLT